jgi:hypothetical protein
VLAYRFQAQQLDRSAVALGDLAVFDIGVQDAATYPAELAFAARLPEPPPADAYGPGKTLALTWSLRGAPYVHRRRDLDRIAAALWPLSEADAAGRLNETGPSVARAGIPALEQLALCVDAMHAVVAAPTAKGAASTAATQRIPAPLRRDCRPCGTRHISDSAMRSAALAAGLEIEPGTAPPVLLPRPKAKQARTPNLAALGGLAAAYLALLGPAGDGDVADYLGVRRADLASAWPAGLVEVRVDGRSAWIPADRVEALHDATPPDGVRLLGPFDPYLQARDRALLVPDTAWHKPLWPVLGRPGVVLVDGEVAGVWRPRAAGAKLTLKVEAFVPLWPRAWQQLDAEAERVAQVRGASSVAVARGGA